MAPETVNPERVMAAEFTVSAELPEDVSVTVFVDVALTATLPKARLAALTVSCGLAVAAPVAAPRDCRRTARGGVAVDRQLA